jgi:hypothetical protein
VGVEPSGCSWVLWSRKIAMTRPWKQAGANACDNLHCVQNKFLIRGHILGLD